MNNGSVPIIKDTLISDGEEISYSIVGEGVPLILVHGYCSSYSVNWEMTGWVRHLVKDGYKVIMLDLRGHGESSKPKKENQYRLAHFARDICHLMDEIGILKCSMMGYSMGARILAWLACEHPERIDKLILGGMGSAIHEPLSDAKVIAQVLYDDKLDEKKYSRTALSYRSFVDSNNGDREALAACVLGFRCYIGESMMAGIINPTLVVCGSDDDVSGSADELAAIMQNAQSVTIPRRDHMRTSGDPRFMEAVIKFLSQ